MKIYSALWCSPPASYSLSMYCGDAVMANNVFYLLDDNIDETYGVNVQFESDEEVKMGLFFKNFHSEVYLLNICAKLAVLKKILCVMCRKGMKTSLVRYEMNTQMKTAKERKPVWAVLFQPM